jgi:hypothetical protein
MDLLEPPRVVERPDRDYLGIRVVTPFRGMLSVRNELIDELDAWLGDRGVDNLGLFFLRLHVIDMAGPMDLELGVMTPRPLDGEGRVQPADTRRSAPIPGPNRGRRNGRSSSTSA